jgi:hypothetical protein
VSRPQAASESSGVQGGAGIDTTLDVLAGFSSKVVLASTPPWTLAAGITVQVSSQIGKYPLFLEICTALQT